MIRHHRAKRRRNTRADTLSHTRFGESGVAFQYNKKGGGYNPRLFLYSFLNFKLLILIN